MRRIRGMMSRLRILCLIAAAAALLAVVRNGPLLRRTSAHYVQVVSDPVASRATPTADTGIAPAGRPTTGRVRQLRVSAQ